MSDVTLVGNISSAVTTLTVNQDFQPVPGDKFLIDDEIIEFGGHPPVPPPWGRSRGTVIAVERGVVGSVAASHSSGAVLTPVLPAYSSAVSPVLQSDVLLFDGYATKPDGIPAYADSGQAWVHYPTSGNQTMQIVSGKLTNLTASGVAAGYIQYDLGAPVTRIGADFTLGPGSTDNGAFGMVTFKTPISSTTIPDANFHLIVTRLNWQLGKFVGNAFTLMAQGAFGTALAVDGTTVHHVDAVLNGTTASILLPDGTAVSVTDAAIGTTPGHIACFERYALDAATDSKSAALAVWSDAQSLRASSRMPDLSPDRLIPILPQLPYIKPVTARWAPAATSVAIPSYPPAEIDSALRVTVNVPPSGGFVADLFGYVGVGASTEVFWSLIYVDTDTAVGSCRPINGWDAVGPYHMRHGRIVVPAGSYAPGSTVTFTFGHWTTVTDASTVLRVDLASAYEAILTVSPL